MAGLHITVGADLLPFRTLTLSSATSTVGVAITDPVSRTVTNVSVTWGSSDAATATAIYNAVNANTAVNSYIVATNPSSGVVGLTYSGPAGLVCNLAPIGNVAGSVAVSGNLGIYQSGQAQAISLSILNDDAVTYTVSNVTSSFIVTGGSAPAAMSPINNMLNLIGQTIAASTTTTMGFGQHLVIGQPPSLALTLSYFVNTQVASVACACTGVAIQLSPPPLVGGTFPTDS